MRWNASTWSKKICPFCGITDSVEHSQVDCTSVSVKDTLRKSLDTELKPKVRAQAARDVVTREMRRRKLLNEYEEKCTNLVGATVELSFRGQLVTGIVKDFDNWTGKARLGVKNDEEIVCNLLRRIVKGEVTHLNTHIVPGDGAHKKNESPPQPRCPVAGPRAYGPRPWR